MSAVQLGIFAVAAARASRGSALAKVEEHADRDWLDRSFAALRAYLETHERFHCDDAWGFMERPREARALGAVIVRASREKLMEQTGECRPSVSSRMSIKPVWRSLVYRGAP